MNIANLKQLMNETGASMGTCKQALEEAGGDVSKARAIAQDLQAARTRPDEALSNEKEETFRQPAPAQSAEDAEAAERARQARDAQLEARQAEAQAALTQRIDDYAHGAVSLTDQEAQLGLQALTGPIVFVETYGCGYKSSMGRLDGHVIRSMPCRGFVEARARLAELPGLLWVWEQDDCYDSEGQNMNSRMDLDWWDQHGADDSSWYRDDPDGPRSFVGIDGRFRPLTEEEAAYLVAGG